MLSGAASHSYAVVHRVHCRRRGAGVHSDALRQAARLMKCSAKSCMMASHPCCWLMQSCVRLRRATGYALSIFIPVSCVCVLPYEAVRWALIGVATLTSGLFLLLNFRGPIFDVAGAKCAPLQGVSGSFAERALRADAISHVQTAARSCFTPGCVSYGAGEGRTCLGSVTPPCCPGSSQALSHTPMAAVFIEACLCSCLASIVY